MKGLCYVPFFTCNKSLQTDGIYVGLTNHMTGSCAQTIYYKCMDDEWLFESKCSYYFKGRCAQSDYFRCENGTLAECTTAETKVGDECCAVIYNKKT